MARVGGSSARSRATAVGARQSFGSNSRGNARTKLYNEVIDAWRELAQPGKHPLILDRTADLILFPFGTASGPHCCFRAVDQTMRHDEMATHRQSSRSMKTFGPKYVSMECDWHCTYGPFPPSTSDLNGCRLSSVPSTSTGACVRPAQNVRDTHSPLMKHWNNRKKKYPLAPILKCRQCQWRSARKCTSVGHVRSEHGRSHQVIRIFETGQSRPSAYSTATGTPLTTSITVNLNTSPVSDRGDVMKERVSLTRSAETRVSPERHVQSSANGSP